MEYLVQMQLNNIERAKPREFLKPVLDKKSLSDMLERKLMQHYPSGGIQLASTQMSRLVNMYKKEGHFAKYKGEHAILTSLEIISEGFNFIIEGNNKRAIDKFDRLKDLPILEKDAANASKFYKEFEKVSQEMKVLLLDVLVCSSKCMYLDSMMILQQSPDGQLMYDKSIQAEKNRTILKQRQ